MPEGRPSRAIAYVPPGKYDSADRCMDHARRQHYDFQGIVYDWQQVHRMLGNGETSVAIVADLRDLDPERKPRVEFVSHPHPPANVGPGGRVWDERTRVIRRPIAGE